MSLLLRVAALVLFILAVILTWVNGISEDVIVALIGAGLAAWVASTLTPGVAVRR